MTILDFINGWWLPLPADNSYASAVIKLPYGMMLH